jgi:hypothetical protein
MEAVNRRASGSPPVLAVGLELAHSLAQPCVLYDSLFLGFFHFKFVLRFVKDPSIAAPHPPRCRFVFREWFTNYYEWRYFWTLRAVTREPVKYYSVYERISNYLRVYAVDKP